MKPALRARYRSKQRVVSKLGGPRSFSRVSVTDAGPWRPGLEKSRGRADTLSLVSMHRRCGEPLLDLNAEGSRCGPAGAHSASC